MEVQELTVGQQIKSAVDRGHYKMSKIIAAYFENGKSITNVHLCRKIKGYTPFTQEEIDIINTALGTEIKLS